MKRGLGQYDPAMMDPAMMDPAMMDYAMMDPAMYPPPPEPSPIQHIQDTFPAAPTDPMMMPGDFPPIMPMEPGAVEKIPPISLWDIKRAWEARDIYLVMLEEIHMHMLDLDGAKHIDGEEHVPFGMRELFEKLRSVMPDRTLESEYERLAAEDAFHKDLLIQVKPFDDIIKRALSARFPIVLGIRKLRVEIKELKGYIARTQQGMSVALWLVKKYGDQVMAIERLKQVEFELTVKLKELQTAQLKVDEANTARAGFWLSETNGHPNQREVKLAYRDLCVDYARRNPEMVFRALNNEMRQEAARRDAEIKDIIDRNRSKAALEKDEFVKFFKTRADQYVTKGTLDESYISAKWQIARRTEWLRMAKQIMDEERNRFAAEGEAMKREGEAIENTSDWYKLTHSAEIQHQAYLLEIRGNDLKTRMDYLRRKSELFNDKALKVQDEMNAALPHYEQVKKFYDERRAYINTEEFKNRMIREFRLFREFKQTHKAIYIYQNFYEDKTPGSFAVRPGTVKTWTDVQIMYMIHFLTTPVEMFVGGVPMLWPESQLFYMSTVTAKTQAIREQVNARRKALNDEANRNLTKQMRYSLPSRVHKIENLLDLYLAPRWFRDFIMNENKLAGWTPARAFPPNREVMIAQSKYNEKVRRLTMIMDRLEKHLMGMAAIPLPQFDDMTMDDRYRMFQKARRVLSILTAHMPAVQQETARIRDKIQEGVVTDSEALAYTQAIRLIKRYAYWTAVMRSTQDEGKRLDQGIKEMEAEVVTG